MTAAEIAEIAQYAKSFNQRLGQFLTKQFQVRHTKWICSTLPMRNC